jgi:hypothetical protein
MPVSSKEMFIWDNQRSHIHSSRGRKSATFEKLPVKGGWALLNSGRPEFSNDMSCALRGKFTLAWRNESLLKSIK